MLKAITKRHKDRSQARDQIYLKFLIFVFNYQQFCAALYHSQYTMTYLVNNKKTMQTPATQLPLRWSSMLSSASPSSSGW
jgi:hypothetical protein